MASHCLAFFTLLFLAKAERITDIEEGRMVTVRTNETSASSTAGLNVVEGLVGTAQMLQQAWTSAPLTAASTTIFGFQVASNVGGTVNKFKHVGEEQEALRKDVEKAVDTLNDGMLQACDADHDGSLDRMKALREATFQALTDTAMTSFKTRTAGVEAIRGARESVTALAGKCTEGRSHLVGMVVSAYSRVWNHVSSEDGSVDKLVKSAAASVLGAKKHNMDCVMEQAVCPAIRDALYQRTVKRISKRFGARTYRDVQITLGDDRVVLYLLEYLSDPSLPQSCGEILREGKGYVCANWKSGCAEQEEKQPVILNCEACSRELIRSGLYPYSARLGGFATAERYAEKNGIPIGWARRLFADVVAARSAWWHVANVLWLSTLAVPTPLSPAVLVGLANGANSIVHLATRVITEVSDNFMCQRASMLVLNAEQETPQPVEAIDKDTEEEGQEDKRLRAQEGLALAAIEELQEVVKLRKDVSQEQSTQLESLWHDLVGDVSKITAAYERIQVQ